MGRKVLMMYEGLKLASYCNTFFSLLQDLVENLKRFGKCSGSTGGNPLDSVCLPLTVLAVPESRVIVFLVIVFFENSRFCIFLEKTEKYKN